MVRGVDGVVCVAYRFDAPPERVFDAWLDRGTVARWLFSSQSGKENSTEIDPTVGGRHSITDRSGEQQHTLSGRYLVIDRPHRLEFTLEMPRASAAADRVAVEIVPDGKGCELTLTQEGLPAGYLRATESSWGGMFDVLASILA